MRCVNCGRIANDENSQCPYCGCPVLSTHEFDADQRLVNEVRRLWDEPVQPPKVVPLPVRPPAGATTAELAADAGAWLVLWVLVLWALGALAHPASWVAAGLAVMTDVAVLRAYGARPWFRLRPGAGPSAPGEESGPPVKRASRG